MAKTDLNIIKNWFKTGLKPTQAQFWTTWDSFWHKDEKLPISSVENLGNILDNKAENNHIHNEYATNDATSLSEENVSSWRNSLGIKDVDLTDETVELTEDYSEFGLENGNSIKSFNQTVYSILSSDDLGSNFANTDLEVDEDRVHTGEATVDFGMPLVFSNPSQKFSGLEDKSNDATYDKILVSDSEGNINTSKLDIPINEFVKNGNGWSLKYKVDNPNKYVVTGENAIDLTKAYSNSAINFGASGKDSFTVGSYNLASGANSISIGYNTKAYGSIGIVIGYQNTAYSPFSGVIGGSSNVIGTEGEITTPISGLNNRAFIFGGSTNKIINGGYSTIVGGASNTINGTLNRNYNTILGGYTNTILGESSLVTIIGGQNNKIQNNAAGSVILGGGSNISQGDNNVVGGFGNHSITVGETLFGLYSSVQDSSLSGNDYIATARVFGVGIGETDTNRQDGLNIYRNGLVTAPTVTNDLVDSNPKALVTKEYFDANNTEGDVSNFITKNSENLITTDFKLTRNFNGPESSPETFFLQTYEAVSSLPNSVDLGIIDDNSEGVLMTLTKNDISLRGSDGGVRSTVLDGYSIEVGTSNKIKIESEGIHSTNYINNKSITDFAQIEDVNKIQEQYAPKVFYVPVGSYNYIIDYFDVSPKGSSYVVYSSDDSGNITLPSSDLTDGQEITVINTTNDVDVNVLGMHDESSIVLGPKQVATLVAIFSEWYLKSSNP